MQVRHLPVVDRHHRISGIIVRKDLQHESVEKRLEEFWTTKRGGRWADGGGGRPGSAEGAAGSDPKTDAEPKSDAEPEMDAEPKADAEPKTDAEPKADAGPGRDGEPKMDGSGRPGSALVPRRGSRRGLSPPPNLRPARRRPSSAHGRVPGGDGRVPGWEGRVPGGEGRVILGGGPDRRPSATLLTAGGCGARRVSDPLLTRELAARGCFPNGGSVLLPHEYSVAAMGAIRLAEQRRLSPTDFSASFASSSADSPPGTAPLLLAAQDGTPRAGRRFSAPVRLLGRRRSGPAAASVPLYVSSRMVNGD